MLKITIVLSLEMGVWDSMVAVTVFLRFQDKMYILHGMDSLEWLVRDFAKGHISISSSPEERKKGWKKERCSRHLTCRAQSQAWDLLLCHLYPTRVPPPGTGPALLSPHQAAAPYTLPERQALLCSPLFRWGHWASEERCPFCSTTWLVCEEHL